MRCRFPRFWNALCMLSSVYKLPWLFSEDGSSVFLHNTANHLPVCTVSLARIPQFGIDCLYFFVDWSTPQMRPNNLFAFCIWQFFFCGAATQSGSWPPHSWGFLDYTQRRTTVGGTPLDEWSASRRDLYLTTHNTHNRKTSMPPVGFEPTISAGERPQTYALDRAATGTGASDNYSW